MDNQDINNIHNYNQEIADKLIKYTLEEYFNYIHSSYYNYIDITFMEYFLSLVPRMTEFCVEHQKLVEFEVIKEHTDNSIIKGCITNEKYGFKENVDYIILTPERSGVKRSGRGGSNGNAKHYNMKPKVFKKLLMRSKNENKYADYYLLLEDIHYFYNDYESKYKNKLISMKDDRIDHLSAQIAELLKHSKYTADKLDKNNEKLEETNEKLEETNEKLEETNEKLEETNEKLEETNEKLEEVFEELHETNEKLHETNEKMDDIKDSFKDTAGRSVPDPEDPNKKSEYVLMKSVIRANLYMILRGTKSYNDTQYNTKYSLTHKIVIRKSNANPTQFFNLLKETYARDYDNAKAIIKANKQIKDKKVHYANAVKVKFCHNKLTLVNDYTEDELLERIKEADNYKYKDYVDSTNEMP